MDRRPLRIFRFLWPTPEANANPENSFGNATTAKGAIYIPAEIAKMYQGATVSGVRIGLGCGSTNVKIFVTEDLNGAPILEETKAECLKGLTSSPVKIDLIFLISLDLFQILYYQ